MMKTLRRVLTDYWPSGILSGEAYLARLRSNPLFAKREISENTDGMARKLCKHYQYFSLDYIKKILDHFRTDALINNPLCMRYIESEFAPLNAQMELLGRLKQNGFSVKDKTVLDIGCSNGCLLFASAKFGAAKVVGIDISEDRLQKAREFLGSGLLTSQAELWLIDIFSQDLPCEKGRFDGIFSTNVLEHIPSVVDYFRQIQKYLNPAGFALTSVCNKYNISNILAEPHYGIPGLILLDRDEAADIWYAERSKLNSHLDYEVFEWFLYDEYRSMALENSLDIVFLLDKYRPDYIDHCLRSYREIAYQQFKLVRDNLMRLGLAARHTGLLAGAIEKYFDEYKRDHAVKDIPPQKKIDLYLKYYAFVLEMITRHKKTEVI